MSAKYKIVVYAIAKDEEQFVDRWVDSMSEADEIIVLDTGSQDNTIFKLKRKGVKVFKKKIKPWRFDVARNKSLELVPKDADICVCTDLDEVFEKGWRQKLENAWQKDIKQARYQYNWSLDEKNRP
ncbi:MAG TPA: glycosyltransferase, partial [Clostridia bacterium]